MPKTLQNLAVGIPASVRIASRSAKGPTCQFWTLRWVDTLPRCSVVARVSATPTLQGCSAPSSKRSRLASHCLHGDCEQRLRSHWRPQPLFPERLIPRHLMTPCPGGFLRPPLTSSTNTSLRIQQAAGRNSHGTSPSSPPAGVVGASVDPNRRVHSHPGSQGMRTTAATDRPIAPAQCHGSPATAAASQKAPWPSSTRPAILEPPPPTAANVIE